MTSGRQVGFSITGGLSQQSFRKKKKKKKVLAYSRSNPEDIDLLLQVCFIRVGTNSAGQWLSRTKIAYPWPNRRNCIPC